MNTPATGMSPIHRLRISATLWQRLRAHHLTAGKRTEAISLALGHVHRGVDGSLTIVLAQPDGLMLFDSSCYERRAFGAAVLRRDVRAQALWRAVREGWTAVVDIHDHHFAEVATFSGVDDRDDQATAAWFSQTLPRFADPAPVAAALLLARQDARARVVAEGGTGTPWGAPMRVDVVGLEGLCVAGLGKASAQSKSDGGAPNGLHARHTGIVPPQVQSHLAELHVAVVGCGGTGSIVAEALARLGVGQLSLIDDDLVESHNLNRLQGAGLGDIGLHKARVLSDRLHGLLPQTRVQPICSAVHADAGRAALPAADVIVGCLDNAETRWWLNQHAVQHLQPYFDVGVLVEPGSAPQFSLRVNTIVPGAGPCGQCTPIEFMPRQRPAAFIDAQALQAQRSAGYVLGAASGPGSGDPSLYGLNLQAVGSLMQEFTSWCCGLPVAHSLRMLTNQASVQRISLQAFGGSSPCDCPLCGGLLGAVDSAALPMAATAVASTHPSVGSDSELPSPLREARIALLGE